MKFQVLLFYKYITIADPEGLLRAVKEEAERLGLLGRIIIASEGINGTLEGEVGATQEFSVWILENQLFADMSIKTSEGSGASFPKLKIKVRDQIVGTQFTKEEADPEKSTVPHLKPEELKKWYEEREDFVIVDMRNTYEYAVGHFKNSINPGLENSRDLKEKIAELLPLKHKKIVTVCTGGIRCEPMSAYLKNKGFEDVYQLENGMHAYMEKYPGEDFLGSLYTFDNRVTMDFGGDREIVGQCFFCKGKTEVYVNCMNTECNHHFLVCGTCALNKAQVFCSPKCEAYEQKKLEKVS